MSHASASGRLCQERGPRRVGGLRSGWARRPGRVLGVARVTRQLDSRPARGGQCVAGHLDQPGRRRRRPPRTQRQGIEVGDDYQRFCGVQRPATSAPTSPGGMEKCTKPNRTVWSVLTNRVSPSAAA